MGRLPNLVYKNKVKLAKKTPLRKKYLTSTYLGLRQPVGVLPIAPVVQYKTFPINKSYLISTLPTHTWSYTLPDLVLGSYVKMVSGVFMQKGDALLMLRLFKSFKNMLELTAAAQSSYKVVEPSFPAQVSPFVLSPKRASLGVVSRLATPIGLKPRVSRFPIPSRPAPRGHKANTLTSGGFLKPSKKTRLLAFRKFTLRRKFLKKLLKLPLFPKPLKFKAALKAVSLDNPPLTFSAHTSKFSCPQQGSLAVWNLLYQQPLLNYSLKYCRLSRRVRKILKNKYRYSKYYFVIAPYKRRLFTLHLWKYVLKFHDERTFFLKFEAFLKNFVNLNEDALLWSLFYTQQRLALKKLLGR